jgi:hypothetical protein
VVNFTLILSAVLSLLGLFQIAAAIVYSRRISGYRLAPVADDELPETLVILSLRGGDDQLAHCLDKLARQNYPRYQLQILIDHPADPVCEVVQRWLATAPPVIVQVDFLRERMPNSTLKCSAVRQVLRQLDPRFQAVVLVDADADPYRHWLRDLVAPLLQPGVGAATGNRWYFPARGSLGGWCRFVYSGLALAPMQWFGLIWAGSLAMRREVAQDESCLQSLAASSSDEAAVQTAVHRLGLRVHFSPRVILWNPEPTSLSACFQFIFRQLLWTRLYHGSWRILFAHAVVSYLLLVAAFFVGLADLGQVHTTAAAWTALGTLAIYAASAVFSLALLHRVIRRNVLPRQESSPAMRPLGLGALVRIVASLPVILAVYTLASVRAQFARRVVWRGVKYRVVPPNGLQIIQYRPFGAVTHEAAPHVRAAIDSLRRA